MIDFARVRWLMDKVPDAEMKLSRARARATRVTPNLDGMPHNHGGGEQMTEAVESIIFAEEYLRDLTEELREKRADIREHLSAVIDPNERLALSMRYLDGCETDEIAYYIGYSDRHIRRLIELAETSINMSDDVRESVI